MPKTYGEGCVAAHALDLVGDRWALLVVRELMLGPKRFGAIRAGLPRIAPNILSQRLDEMAASGLIRHQMLPPPASVAVYALTEAGAALWPVIAALCRWGARQPGHDPRQFISPTALMLSMQALGQRAGPPVAAGFVLGGEAFEVRLGRGRYDVARVARPAAPVVFSGSANAVAGLVYGPLPVTVAAGQAGPGRFEGDPALAQGFVDRFRLAR